MLNTQNTAGGMLEIAPNISFDYTHKKQIILIAGRGDFCVGMGKTVAKAIRPNIEHEETPLILSTDDVTGKLADEHHEKSPAEPLLALYSNLIFLRSDEPLVEKFRTRSQLVCLDTGSPHFKEDVNVVVTILMKLSKDYIDVILKDVPNDGDVEGIWRALFISFTSGAVSLSRFEVPEAVV